GDGQLLDLELHPAGEDQRVVGVQRQRPLGDVVEGDVRAGITGEGAGEGVTGDQRRGDAVGQRRVARAVDLVLAGSRRDGDGQLLDLELHPAGEDERVVGVQRQRPLGDVVEADVRAGNTRKGAGEGVTGDQRRGDGVGQRRVARAVDLVLAGSRRDGDGQLLDLELHPRSEGERVVGAQDQRALGDVVEGDVRASNTREGAGEGVTGDQRRGDAVGQRRVARAVDLVLAGSRRDGDTQLFDLELHARGEDERVVGAQGQRALGDVVEGDVRAGITGEGAGEGVTGDQRRGDA